MDITNYYFTILFHYPFYFSYIKFNQKPYLNHKSLFIRNNNALVITKYLHIFLSFFYFLSIKFGYLFYIYLTNFSFLHIFNQLIEYSISFYHNNSNCQIPTFLSFQFKNEEIRFHFCIIKINFKNTFTLFYNTLSLAIKIEWFIIVYFFLFPIYLVIFNNIKFILNFIKNFKSILHLIYNYIHVLIFIFIQIINLNLNLYLYFINISFMILYF